MPIDPNSIAWDSSPKVAPPAHADIAWDDHAAAPAAKPGYYDDGSYDFHNTNGILGWLQAADRLSGRASHRLSAGVGRLGQGVAQNIGLDGVADWFGNQARMDEAQGAAPVPGAVTWDDVKAHPGVGNVLSYIGQQGVGATPDLAAVAVAPWLYAGSREGDIAHVRAANSGHGEQIGLGDLAAAAPIAAIDTGLMKYGLGGILGGEGYGVLKGALRAAGRDAIMGAGQPVVDQIGERLGTDTPIDWNEAGDQALAGAVSMAPFGAAAHLGVRGVRAMGKPEEAGPSPERRVAVREQLTPEQADALTLHGIDVDTLEDVHMARKAADRLLQRQPAQHEAPPVIATPHGNVAPNADEHGRKFETIDQNGGAERAKFESRVVGVESRGDPNAKNPRSSASGLGQFTDDTFVRTYQKRFGTGESRESILAKKNDPRLAGVMLRDLTNSNEDVLRRSGVPLTAGNYYLAHFAGAGGAVKLNRNLDAPVERILGQKVVDANPFLTGLTGRDVLAWADHKMGEGGGAPLPAGHMVDYPLRPSERGEEPIYRAADHSGVESTEPYGFDPANPGQHRASEGTPFDTGNMGAAEDMRARSSKLQSELEQPGAHGEGMATGGMERPFKADANTGEFENVQRERVKQAEAETEKRFEARRAEAERLKAEFEARRNRAGQSDASAKYQQTGTKPHYNPDMGAFHTTEDGFVADEAGNPVVWPTQGAAAKWAARFKMGGDFELQAHGTSTRGGEQPVTLQRKPGSTYGQEPQAKPAEEAQQGPVPQLEHIDWHDVAPPQPAPAAEPGPVGANPEDRNSRTVKMKPVGPDEDGVYRSQIGREPRMDAPAGKSRERSRTIGEIHNDATASRRADRFDYQDRGAEGVDVRDTGGGAEGNLDNAITRERAKDKAPRLTPEQKGAAKTAREDFNDAVTAAKADAELDPNPKEHTTVELKTARGHVTHYQVERTPEALDRLHERVNKLPDHAFYSRDLHEEAPAGHEGEPSADTREGGYDVFRETPRNSIPREVLKDGMDADRAFDWIAQNSKDEFHRQLANTLLDLTEGVKISLYDKAGPLPKEYEADLRNAHGAVVHKGNQARIFLNSGKYGHGLSEETLLHEGIHAAIATRIGSLRNVDGKQVDAARGFGQDVRRISVLQRYVADHIQMLDRTREFKSKNYSYETMKAAQIASENVDEFLTYALTDKEFQRMLADIKVPDVHGETARLTGWQQFVNVLRRMVGLDPKYQAPFEKLLDADNALNSTIDTANEHFDRLAEKAPEKQDAAEFDRRTNGEAEQRLDRRTGEDRREFGRAPRDTELDRRSDPERRPLRASDAGVETAGDRRQTVREDNERRRVESRTGRVVAGAKALLNDQNGSLNVDAVAKFFVDLDTVKDAKDGIKRLAESLKGSSATDVLAKTLDSSRMAGRFISSYFHTIDARWRGLAARYNSDTIRQMADLFHARAGHADGTDQTYHEAVHNNSRRWNKVLFDTLHPFAGDDAALERVRNIIAQTGTGSVEEKAAAARLAKLLKEIHDYRLDAGEDLGEVANGYFPRVLNPEIVVKHGDEFKQLAEGLFVKSGDSVKDAKAKAEQWFHHVVNENAGLDGSILDVRRAKAPGTTSGLPRKLHKDADTVLAKFYQKDPLDVLSAYVTGSTKRAEFTRRFGVPGREGSKERADWIAEHGHDDQLDVYRKKINEDILASSKDPGDTQDQINSFLEANLGILGKQSSATRTAVSMLHAYNQIAKMDHSLITSFNELAMGFVRGGPVEGVKFLGTTIKEFGRELLKMEPSEARRYAEHLGLILNPLMDQVLQSRISAIESSRGTNKMISRFYKVIGLHQFTEAERIAAAKMAREHLNVLAGDLASGNARTARRAERALAELGITDHAEFKKFVDDRSGKVTFGEIDTNKSMAAKWSNAVARMTNQTVMEPTRGIKPLWANHPVGSLLYGLMGYTFAFKKNVLDRTGALAMRGLKEKDPHLFMPLLFGMPILAAFTYLNDTYLRPALFGSSYDFAHETPFVAALRTADRASMLGAISPFTNAMFGTKYTRSLSEAFMGSVVGSGAQLAEKIVVKPVQAAYNGQEGNGASRNAAGALYDMFIEPAVDAAAVSGIGGKVATGIVYASGSRPGSIFPQDREAFIDGVAGPLEDHGGSSKPFGKNSGPFKQHKSALGKTF